MKSGQPPKYDKRTHKPKTDRQSGAPFRSESSDKPSYPRKPAGGPRFGDSPRSGPSDRPRYPRPAGGPRFGDSPRSDSSDRPHYPRKPGSGPRYGDSPRSDSSDRPHYPRKPGSGPRYGDSPRPDSSDRPRYPRPAGGPRYGDSPRSDSSDRPRYPRPAGGPRYGDSPRSDSSDRPHYPRKPAGGPRYGDSPRSESSDRPHYPRRPAGESRYGDSPRSDSSDRPRFSRRPSGDRRFDSPRRSISTDRPKGPFRPDRDRLPELSDRPEFPRKFEPRDRTQAPPRTDRRDSPDISRAPESERPTAPFHKPEPRRDAYRKPEEHTAGLFRVYGRKPVLEVLQLNLVRSLEVHKNAHGLPIEEILRIATEQHLTVKRVDSFPEEDGVTNQGVVALVEPPVLRDDLRRFLRELPESPTPLLLMLDGITDPHNFGAILRTADAAGVNAVIIRERRQVPVTDVVVKTSAGAAYLVPIFQVVNLSQTLSILSNEGFWSVATMSTGEGIKPYGEYDWKAKTVLIMGAEGSGVSELLAKEADDRIGISMHGKVDSLNVSVATGVLLFEAAKSRISTKKS